MGDVSGAREERSANVSEQTKMMLSQSWSYSDAQGWSYLDMLRRSVLLRTKLGIRLNNEWMDLPNTEFVLWQKNVATNADMKIGRYHKITDIIVAYWLLYFLFWCIYCLFTCCSSSSKVALCKRSNPWKCRTEVLDVPQSAAQSGRYMSLKTHLSVCHTSWNCDSLFFCSRQLMTMQWQREWSLAWGELNDAQRWGC